MRSPSDGDMPGGAPAPTTRGPADQKKHAVMTSIERAVMRRLKEEKKVPPWAKITAERIAVYNDIRPESEKEEPEVEVTSLMAYNYWLRGVQSDAMRLINHLNMSAFRKQFQAQKGPVDLTTFIRIVRRIMGSGRQRDRAVPLIDGLEDEEVTARLMELFREIDLDGDGKIVWEEFTRFILDKATQVGQQLEPEERDAAIFPYRPMRRPGPAAQHTHKRKNPYEMVVALTGRTLVAAVEHESSVVHFHDMRRHAAHVGSIRCRAKVLAMLHLPHLHNTFVTSHADMVMRTWNLDDGPSSTRWSIKTQWPLADNQHCLCYAPSHGLLFSGATGGTISGWSVPERELKTSFPGHSDTVLDLLSLSDLDCLASGSSDTSVCIWDLHVGRLRQKLAGHQRAVVSLGFCSPLRMLVSGGYDHEAFVWSPFVSTLLHKLVGHAAPISAVQSVVDRPEMITGDSAGVVKIWDLRTYRCLQTFVADEGTLALADNKTQGSGGSSGGGGGGSMGTDVEADGVASIAHVVISRSVSRLAVATKRLNYYEQERATSADISDDLPISCAVFNEVCLTIVTAAGRGVKVWDAILGNVKAAYPEVARADITAMCLDDRHRKIIFGDTLGDVGVVTHHSGTFMKAFDKTTDAAVAAIIYAGPAKQVLVAYSDYSLCLFDEGPIQHVHLLRRFSLDEDLASPLSGAYLSAAAFSPHRWGGRGPYVVTGSGRPNDPLALWSYAVGRCEAFLVEGEEDAPVPLDTLREAQKDAHKEAHKEANKEVNTEGQANDLDPPPTSQPSEEQEQGQRQDDQSNHPSYSILSATFLGDSPLLAVSCSDGTVRVWTSWPLLGPKRACVLTFENAEPPHGYTFDGEEDELCPLLHRIGTGGPPRLPSRPAAVKPKRDEHGLPVKPKAIIIPEDPHLRDWKVMPRLDSPRRRVAVPAPCLVWDPCGGHCLLTGDESGRIRRWDVSDLFLRLEQARLLVREANGWRTAAMAAEEEHSLLQQLEELRESRVTLLWGLDAHDDAITTLSVVSEPKGILSGSVDQCVKMWSLRGRPFGRLLQSVLSSNANREWSLHSLDVDTVMQREDNAIHAVEDMVLAEQKRRALRREVLTACPSLFSLEASTIATQPSILSLDSHATLASSTLGTSSSVMTTVSEEGHHKALMYLASLDKAPLFSRKPQPVPPRLAQMSAHPNGVKYLQALRMDMTLKAARARDVRRAPSFSFHSKPPKDDTHHRNHTHSSRNNHHRPRTAGDNRRRSRGHRPINESRLQETADILSAAAAAAVEPLRIPVSPGRKEHMEPLVEDAIHALRRRLSWIDARAPPPLFPARRADFHDFAKDVMSPMLSGENSTFSLFSGVANDLPPPNHRPSLLSTNNLA